VNCFKLIVYLNILNFIVLFWKCLLWLFVYFPDLCQWWKLVQKSHYMALPGRRKQSNDCSWSVCIVHIISVLCESYVWQLGNVWIAQHFWHILIMKANKMHCFSHLFDKVLYMFRTCPLSIIRSISTLYTRNRYLSF